MRKHLPFWSQVLTQVALLLVALFVLIPLWGLARVAFDGSIKSVPTSLNLLPEQPTLDVFARMWKTPSQSLSFPALLGNSLIVAGSAAMLAVILGATMAYAFARFRFKGRQIGLFAILVGAFLPLVALMTPLYILLEQLHLRRTMFGLILVYLAFALPFCIWNMRSAFQTVDKELEEAAFLDGAAPLQTFWTVTLPMVLPAIGVAALLAFLTGYSEFAIGWLFVENSKNVTVAMALWGIVTMGGSPWSQMAAMAIMMAVPVVIIFMVLQRTLFDRMIFGQLRE